MSDLLCKLQLNEGFNGVKLVYEVIKFNFDFIYVEFKVLDFVFGFSYVEELKK